MPTSRSAKEICREDPDSISCSVATNREKRKKKRAERYGEPEEEAEVEVVEPSEEEAPPISKFNRQAQLDEMERKAGSK